MRLFTALLLFATIATAQNQASDSIPLHLRELPRHQLSASLGIAQPLGDFKSIAGSGLAVGLDYEYYLDNKWGISVGARHASYQSAFDRIDGSSFDNERLTSITLGPVLSIQWNRFQIDALARGGIGFLDLNQSLGGFFMFETLIIPEEINTAFTADAALRFNYYFRRSTQLFFSVQYQSTISKPIDYNVSADFDFDKLSIIGPLEPRYNQSIDLSGLALSVGVKIALGRKYTSGELRVDN